MNEPKFISERLERFRRAAPALERARAALEARLSLATAPHAASVSSLSSRTKSEASVQGKLARPDRTYASLWEVTDLIGMRVVARFESSISDLARAIEASFDVDLAHSNNRLRFDDHERFGYRSLHYVCKVPPDLLEEAIPADARFEIQIRSSLQNVWAELEHGLGYKASEIASPALRRRFSRVANLLEIADEELDGVRRELRHHVEAGISAAPLDSVEVERLANDSKVAEADREIAERYGLPLGPSAFFPDYLAKALKLSGLETAAEARSAFSRLRSLLSTFVPAYFRAAQFAWGLDPGALGSIERGYSLLFLAHLRALEAESLSVDRVRALQNLYLRLDRDQSAAGARQIAVSIVEIWEQESASTFAPSQGTS